jgi:hypothetical protein
MASITLSNGEEMDIPEGTAPADVERYRVQGESFIANEGKLATPADNGTDPLPVDPHNVLVSEGKNYAKSWFPEGEAFPGATAATEYGSNYVQGVLNLANAVPNTLNNLQSLYDLHVGTGTGEVAPEDQFKPWVNVPQIGTTTPGWEGTQESAEIAGASAPLLTEGLSGLFASTVAMPALVKGGRVAGRVVDNLTGNQDTHKWEKTLETGLPMVAGGIRVAKNAPVTLPRVHPALKGAFLGSAPATALSLMAAKMGIKGMDKALVGAPRGLAKDIPSAVQKTLIPSRLDDRKER